MDLHLDDYERRRCPGRTVQGISAVLLPYSREGRIDEPDFRRHLRRTLDAGLRVAVNMDTGYVDLLTPEEKRRVLQWTAETIGGRDWFAAGALPDEAAGLTTLSYARECAAIAQAGGVPVIFPSSYTAALDEHALSGFFRDIATAVERFLAFELGAMFNPNGRMFSSQLLGSLMEMPQCFGLKHSSLDRRTELERLELRDRVRPDFVIYSGNDLAPDMIEYGSDYLLGLSTFAPEAFAARDQAWARGEAQYLELRDFIHYLGWIGFHEPVPAYRHSAAIFLKLTGGLTSDQPHPRAPRREEWDRSLLADAARRLERLLPLAPRLNDDRKESDTHFL
jgi:dihydrodipicolinate synthase/N-acetylneuraminate lyase